MNNLQNPMTEMYHSQLEASRRFADVLFSGTERIDHVVIEATHHAFTNQLNLAHAAVSLRDPKELASMQSNMLAHRPDNAINLQKEMMRVFSEMQNEMGKSMKDYLERFGAGMTRGIAAPVKSAAEKGAGAVTGAGADAMASPITGMFSMWENALHEVASIADKNLSATVGSIQRATDDARHTTVQANETSAEQTAGIAKIAAQAAAEAAATVLHEHLNATRGPNGAGAGSSGNRSGRAEQAEAYEEQRSHSSGAKRK